MFWNHPQCDDDNVASGVSLGVVILLLSSYQSFRIVVRKTHALVWVLCMCDASGVGSHMVQYIGATTMHCNIESGMVNQRIRGWCSKHTLRIHVPNTTLHASPQLSCAWPFLTVMYDGTWCMHTPHCGIHPHLATPRPPPPHSLRIPHLCGAAVLVINRWKLTGGLPFSHLITSNPSQHLSIDSNALESTFFFILPVTKTQQQICRICTVPLAPSVEPRTPAVRSTVAAVVRYVLPFPSVFWSLLFLERRVAIGQKILWVKIAGVALICDYYHIEE